MGKHKYIETPEKMWELFKRYTSDAKKDPILVHDFVGKDAEEVRREKERPLSMEGFELWLHEEEVIQSVDQYFANQDGLYDNYMGVCSRVRKAIRKDQIDGGMAGIYNPSITQRLNNLTEKTEVVKSKGKLPEWMRQKP